MNLFLSQNKQIIQNRNHNLISHFTLSKSITPKHTHSSVSYKFITKSTTFNKLQQTLNQNTIITMGTCASVQYSTNRGTLLITNGSSTTAMVINSIDGKLQQFRQPIKAGNVISDHDSNTFFLCNAEDMYVNCHVPHVPGDEDLRPGQIYFIMPISKLYRPITLQELCLLAIKASSAIEKSVEVKKTSRTMSFKELSRTTSLGGRRKRNGNQKVDFQLALKQLA